MDNKPNELYNNLFSVAPISETESSLNSTKEQTSTIAALKQQLTNGADMGISTDGIAIIPPPERGIFQVKRSQVDADDKMPGSELKQGNSDTYSSAKDKSVKSMYWYANDPILYKEEVIAMNKQFPQFKLRKLSDGRLCWIGTVRPESVRKNAKWTLMLVYAHNHPSNNNYGGSIRVYVIEPDLDDMNKKLGGIKHLLRDSSGNICLCLCRPEDFLVGRNRSTSAVSCVAWAVKWIVAFELWLAGDISTQEWATL